MRSSALVTFIRSQLQSDESYHVFHTIHRGGVHDFDLRGILGGDPVLLPLLVHQLDLPGVGELDGGSNGHFKLPTCCVVQPDLVSLGRMRELKVSTNSDCSRTQKGEGL